VVYSKPARETYAQFHLAQKGLEVFFPQLQVPTPLATHRALVPLFPNYLFVRLQMPGRVSCGGVVSGGQALGEFQRHPGAGGQGSGYVLEFL